jgi:hypothetical protein
LNSLTEVAAVGRDLERAGLARAFFIFVVGVGLAGVLIAVLNGPFDTIAATGSSVADTSQAARGQGYIEAFWDSIPVVIALLAFLQLLGAAAAEGRFS